MWGDGDAGQLGLGNFAHHHSVAINNSFPAVRAVSAGGNHSAVIIGSSDQVFMGSRLISTA